ncbi:SDR family oxidoreductase [Bradyrhizobium brasilense]|uniref:SDR family NAD(P)-dependent oxidoreductase n=1 Tax=Bradyrhizobium brasilense TaxID=1419277 RepID=UPI0024B19C44|nr:SDR family oxidoreductase [Bradyrhizobium australafricanum]WFU31353.1 SDR family oxidoreductase [Bradyrhizobium australafricanum]
MSDVLDLGGRVAFVTGAGQGVGRQIALRLAANNSGGVAVNDYLLDRAERVAEEIRATGGKALAVQADVTDLESVRAAVKKAEITLGNIGTLINNAGNFGARPHADAQKPFWETGPGAWNSSIGVNFYGVINCTSTCVPSMIARGAPGRIITIISEASRYGDVGLEVYAGAKAGAAGFMRATARALGRYEITANCVALAGVSTPPVEESMNADPERAKKVLQKYVIRRLGRPEEVANMVLFLASEAGSYITGQTYGVNGGFVFGQ